MKILKKVICIVVVVMMTLIVYVTSVRATTTLKVTADTLNLREKASTSSDILTLLSKGETCELIEESGDWYKVQYKTYTGYVSKEYVKENEDTSQSNTDQNDNSSDTKDNNQQNTDTNVGDGSTLTTAKISTKTDVKIVPLIYSSKIDELNKDTNVTILTEINGWAYIQTDTITGWIRNDNITSRKVVDISSNDDNKENTQVDNPSSNNTENNSTNTTENNAQTETNNTNIVVEENNQTTNDYTEKTMYVNDSYVNVRKEPNTSSEIVMVLELNQKLTVIGEEGEWYKVKTSEGNAYISKKLLSSKQVTSSRGVSLTSHTSAGTTQVSKNNTATNDTNTSTSTSSSSSKGKEIVAYAKQFLGVPYVYGGASKSGFDCSGFTMYVYNKFGISMPHGAQSQSKLGKTVSANKNSTSSLKENLQPGDLVFFLDYETMDEIGHCGIYIGNGDFIHASSGSGYCVKINSLLPGEYYNTRYCGARRVI